MTQASLITRFIRAAEEWARGRYREDVVAVGHDEPTCCADGRIETVVELDAVRGRSRPRRVRCIVTLELDGTIACFEAGAVPVEHATRE